MRIREIHSLYFSPTGGTAKYAKAMAAGAAEALACPAEVSSFTLPREREEERHFSSDELLIIGSPTYAGKLPNKILPEFQEKLRGEHTPILLFVSYGNRNFDNSLAELLSVLRTNGFLPLAAAAFACRHAFSDRICPERPRVEERGAQFCGARGGSAEGRGPRGFRGGFPCVHGAGRCGGALLCAEGRGRRTRQIPEGKAAHGSFEVPALRRLCGALSHGLD